ncbi:MAG: AAA family ATPase [Pseudomonadota bacterium]|nr:AAA family ATPase [Pseudomonadota bacterium]
MIAPLKLLDDNPHAMTEPSAPSAVKLNIVPPGLPEGEAEARAAPLRIEYSSTQVMHDALVRLQRTHGVVKPDRSALAESFKMLRNQVLQRMRADGYTLLAVTSPRRIEGKSLTAVNLALTIAADYDSAVLLVDADLTGQGLQSMFGLDSARGLSDHLTHGVPIPELLVNPGVPRFVLLPAGQHAGLNSSELLATRLAQQLIQEMKQRYQDRYIIIDLPPLLDTADALAFLPQVDTTLVVVEEHTTSMQDMETMAELLAPFNLIGTVMSQARETEKGTAERRPPWYRRLVSGFLSGYRSSRSADTP